MPQFVKYNAQSILVVTVPEMVQCGVSDVYLRKVLNYQRNGQVSCWPHHKDGIVYIHFNGLKQQYKDLVKNILCGGQEVEPFTLWHNLIEPELMLNSTDADVIDRFKTADGKCLSFDLTKKYSEQCKWLNFIVNNESKSIIKQKFNYNSVEEFYNMLLPHLKSAGLPGSYNRLRILVREYKERGAMAVISGKVGNTNKLKFKNEEQVAAFWSLASFHNNLNHQQIANQYNKVAAEKGWQTISSRAAWDWRAKLRANVVPGINGEREFDNVIGLQVKRRRPTEPLKYVTIDGWDIELRYQQSVLDKKGNKKTVYDLRQKVIVILDPYTDYPLGWAIADTENTVVIKQALKNAIIHTKELFGEYHRIYQGQTDGFGSKELTELYTRVFKYYTPAKIGNSKSKVIEPYWAHINKTYCQLQPNWTGFGMDSRKESRPNKEWLDNKFVRHMVPDKDENTRQINAIFEAERAAKRDKYIERYQYLKDEERLIIDRSEFLMIFGQTTGYTNQLTGKGLMPTINGLTYTYDCFSAQFRRLTHLDWTVLYDREDMSTVLAVADNGRQRFLLEEKYVQPMALADRSEGDSEQLQRVFDFNKAQKAEIISENEAMQGVIEKMIASSPSLAETLLKNRSIYGGQQKRIQESVRKALTTPDDTDSYNKNIESEYHSRMMASPSLQQILNNQIKPDNK